jgi:heptosyltransferase-2
MPFEDISTVLRLKEQGFRLIGISNQSGIARGTVNEDFVKEINSLFLTDFGFDGFYYCPHHPDEHCSCRKPEPGMLFRARTQHKTDFSQSYMVGDKESDMLLAKAVGAKGVYVTTGENKESSHADFMAGSLKEATDIILMDSR